MGPSDGYIVKFLGGKEVGRQLYSDYLKNKKYENFISFSNYCCFIM